MVGLPYKKSSTHFGGVLSNTLNSVGMNQSDLAETLGFSNSYVNHLVTGHAKAGSKTVETIASTLKVSDAVREKLHYAAAIDAGFKLDLTKE